MTKNKKEILNNLLNEATSHQIGYIKNIVEDFNYDFPYRIHKWSGNIYNDVIKLDGFYLNLILKQEILNNSPRKGIEGDYILVKKNKENIEEIEFIKKILKIY